MGDRARCYLLTGAKAGDQQPEAELEGIYRKIISGALGSAWVRVDDAERGGQHQRFIDAGADEIVTYGSTPTQNAELIAAWRDR